MIYEIKTYDLIGKIIYVYKERPDLKIEDGKNGKRDKFIDAEGKEEDVSRLVTLSNTLSRYKGAINIEEFPIYLPFFADVTEDLPGSCKFEPRTWKGCQLLTQKHGGYLEFFHHETKKTLRIAINSNTYSPLNLETRKVIVKHAPISERYWNVGDEAKIENGQIRLGGAWFPFDERYSVEQL